VRFHLPRTSHGEYLSPRRYRKWRSTVCAFRGLRCTCCGRDVPRVSTLKLLIPNPEQADMNRCFRLSGQIIFAEHVPDAGVFDPTRQQPLFSPTHKQKRLDIDDIENYPSSFLTLDEGTLELDALTRGYFSWSSNQRSTCRCVTS
jgi:hypothetical protein